MTQHANDTPEQVLKFVPKEKAQNKLPQADEAGQAIVAQIRTAADLAKEDCDRAMSLAHKLSWSSERPKTEPTQWKLRLRTGESEQPARNNGFRLFRRKLKRSFSCPTSAGTQKRPSRPDGR